MVREFGGSIITFRMSALLKESTYKKNIVHRVYMTFLRVDLHKLMHSVKFLIKRMKSAGRQLANLNNLINSFNNNNKMMIYV